MLQRLRKLFAEKPGIRYLVVGGSVYALELVVIVVAQTLGATAVEAVAVSFVIGLIVSFILQKLVTFQDRRMHHRIVLGQALAVTVLVVWNFLFTIAVTKWLAGHLPAVITRTIALLITTVWNFYLYKTRIFNAPEEIVY